MKLKTLKDLIIDKGYVVDNIIDKNWVNSTELKQEAIKWIKFGRKNLNGEKENPTGFNIEKLEIVESGVSQFILEFFNITEEDLK